jgi:hypothetical protein
MKRLPILVAILLTALLPVAKTAGMAPGTMPSRFFSEAWTAPTPKDTIIINMPNQAKITLVVKNTDQLSTLREYHLDSLLVLLSKYAKQVEEAAKSSDAKQITLDFYPSRDSSQTNAPEKVTITMSTTRRGGSDRNKGSENIEILIAKALRIDVDYDETKSKTTVRVNRQSDSTQVRSEQQREEKKFSRSTKLSLDVDLGLNTFINSQPYLDPLLQPVDYDLRPLGSRYVSVNTHIAPRIGGPSSPLHLRSGLEFAFNNFMFDENITLREIDNQTVFFYEPDRTFQKTKLATSSVNVPLMVMLRFKNQKGNDGFTLAAGGFVGHRLGSHTKVKYSEDGRTNKDKDRGNFNLTDVQYGTNFIIGFGSLQLFAKYNMNPLFRDSRGPEVNVFSFGITLLD